MKRYRVQKGMAIKAVLCFFIIIAAIIGLLLGIHSVLGNAQEEVVLQTNNIKPSQTAPAATDAIVVSAIVTLNKTMIRQQGDLVIVNKQRLWPKGLEPEDLVDIRDYKTTLAYSLKDNAMRADKTAVMALDRMLSDAAEEGINSIVIMSSYRGYEKQSILFEQQVTLLLAQTDNREQAEEIANTTVARPGESEHHTGLAFDLSVQETDMKQFGETTQGQWIEENCASYGFVLRYPPQKANLTGISSEPWHIRYVGVAAAQQMEQNNWCLEEYVEHNP